ncbi:venom dipeptidyl peptidase 4-like [Melitaea cinxia]|uniref:venom dipeptidyl peptidase 4-like n=1 Tax=Melitaea cinxia TaxID=113334 RepID=UPI001E26F288|nr:venom dipeptidyl peptidase 4-like [Melitaea cinxia]
MAWQTVYLALALVVTESFASPQRIQKTFTLEELVPLQVDFFPERVAVQWISDSEYVVVEPGLINKYDAAKDTYVTVLDHAELFNLSRFSVSSFSNDQKYLLMTTNKRKVYRYSSIAEYAVYDLEKKSIAHIGNGSLQVVVWGNDHALAFVQYNNVFYVPDVAKPDEIIPLTVDGVVGNIYNGVTDWIYEEEVFNAAEAMWFSPNGTYLAVASFNDTQVESAVYPYYGESSEFDNQYPLMIHFKYPKAGRTNPVVQLRVFKLKEKNIESMVILPPVDIIGPDHILGRVNWATDENLILLWLNRRQNVSVLVNCDLTRNECNIMKHETEPNGWIEVREIFFDKTGTKMLEIQPLPYGEQRFMHLGRFDFNTMQTEDLTPGNSTTTEVLGWNLDTDTVYYIVSPGMEPWKRQLWATSKGKAKCVTCNKPHCHDVDAAFSPSGSYAIVSCSALNVPAVTYFYTSETDTFKTLADNSRLTTKLKQYKLPMVLFNVITLGEKLRAHIKLLLPPEMEKDKKYPMIVRLYAGPGTSRVRDSYDLEYYSMYLSSNRSFIVASIDVRGSAVMGVEALHAVNEALGTVEITDTLDAIRQLLKMHSFIDPHRVGVWGWSYGGYASTMMLIKDEEKTLACAAAVAPVTSWLYYDSIYTERYMDTPKNNPKGYENSDLMKAAEKLRGRKYLIVHGTGDDNVHIQHSMQLAKRLQRADIAFEQMSYTDENHSLRGVSRHFYHTLEHFWTECFDDN